MLMIARLKILSPRLPERRKIEVLGSLEMLVERLDLENARRAVSTDLTIYRGDHVPGTALENDTQRLEGSLHLTLPAAIPDTQRTLLPDRLSQSNQVRRLGQRR